MATDANDTGGTETTTPETASQRAPIYEALRSLNPNTLNLTIFWSCVSSAGDGHLSKYDEFQKNDASYLQCKADGHLVYERSCLHNLLVASNCFDGIWNCGAQWLHSADYVVQWIRHISQKYPQCFTDFNATSDYELTWDCEDRCDLPCNYPDQFCATITKSYNATVCEMECAKGSNRIRRLRQGAHDMTLKFGSSPAPSGSASIAFSAQACYWRSIIAVSIAMYALALQ